MPTKRSMREIAKNPEFSDGVRLWAMQANRSVKARVWIGKESDAKRQLRVTFSADRVGIATKCHVKGTSMPILIDLISLDDAQRLVTDLSTAIEMARLAATIRKKAPISN